MKLERYGMIGSQKGLNMLREYQGKDTVDRPVYDHIATCNTQETAKHIAQCVNACESGDFPTGHFNIGQFKLGRNTLGGVSIYRCDGEGGTFNEQLLETAIAEFYNKHF